MIKYGDGAGGAGGAPSAFFSIISSFVALAPRAVHVDGAGSQA